MTARNAEIPDTDTPRQQREKLPWIAVDETY